MHANSSTRRNDPCTKPHHQQALTRHADGRNSMVATGICP
eukprot:CAMPEP_0115304372 /NCGR_PEP_ID=MMETSP0270-20121206/71428_1 /TAXON_ID=71861 /ORGANISM="Scrippsiella trochoidea, Strain CCMP3099" /LENGTH=39 /DNA_ID= /DNA_START= /DNA_END= /DNA_ORIENTATION=